MTGYGRLSGNMLGYVAQCLCLIAPTKSCSTLLGVPLMRRVRDQQFNPSDIPFCGLRGNTCTEGNSMVYDYRFHTPPRANDCWVKVARQKGKEAFAQACARQVSALDDNAVAWIDAAVAAVTKNIDTILARTATTAGELEVIKDARGTIAKLKLVADNISAVKKDAEQCAKLPISMESEQDTGWQVSLFRQTLRLRSKRTGRNLTSRCMRLRSVRLLLLGR